MSKTLLALGITSLLATSSWGSVITFSDGDFGSWNSDLGWYGSTPQDHSLETIGGNPGNFLKITTTTGGATSLSNYKSSFSYNPANGAIVSLNFSIDVNEIYTYGQGQGYGPIVIQDGVCFSYQSITAGTGNNWVNHSFVGLDSSSFLNSLDHPDFSAGAKPLTFGFWTGNSGGPRITVGYDNFETVLFTAVPEPSTYLAGLSALGMLGLFGWRNRK